MGGAQKYIMPAFQTAVGAGATAMGQPQIGVPMMVGGVTQGAGPALGGSAGKGIAGLGALASMAGGMMGGGGGSTADAAAAAGRMPSTDLMSSAMGASGGSGPMGATGGLGSMAPMLQKYGPMLAKAGMDAPTPTPPPQMQPPQMGRMAAQPAPINIPQAGAAGPPNPMSALQAYRSFLQQQTGG